MQRKFTCEEENLLGCEHKQHGIEIKNEVARCQVGSVNKMFRTCPSLIINEKKHSMVDKQMLKKILILYFACGARAEACPFLLLNLSRTLKFKI